jgi:LuxR family maltose regulon positive regulatory protein
VLRPGLVERLNDGLHCKLTLISAPAGFGKTTLASEWLSGCKRPSAWLSLDEGDSDFSRFLMYFVAALQTLKADVGVTILTVLKSPLQTKSDVVLTSLLNEIIAMPDDFILVLDDYHAIEATSIDNVLAFMLEHGPPQMHLVITTREDPNLPLAKWRARGQLTELRAADLRFSASEAVQFFNQTMGFDLSEDDIAALENRTEGWIAGLQMAALSMQRQSDIAGFIRAFSGSHRFVLDYLIEEVLRRQPESVRDFLLQTSILDELCSPLCDAVTKRKDGGEMLEVLECGNLFVVPLDDRRQWYRYHHLFADVLRVHLAQTQPERISALHRRASEWYWREGLAPEAITHALAAGDFERAADLLELAGPAMEESPQSAAWLIWVKALPDDLIRMRPVLSVRYAFALFSSGAEMCATESRLKDAEQWLAHPDAGMIIVDQEQFQSLPITIAVARTYHAQSLGDLPGTVTYAKQALSYLPDGDIVRRGQISGLLGLSYWANGDLEAAGRIFGDYSAKLWVARNIPDALGTAFVFAEIRIAQGQLTEAEDTILRSLQFVTDLGLPLPPDAADLYRVLGELYRERGDLVSSAENLAKSEELTRKSEILGFRHRLCVAKALLKQAQGDLDGALDLLYEAERQYIMTPLPVFRPVSAMKARVWCAQGKLAEAIGWATECGLSVDDELSYLHEFEHITLARILFAQLGQRSDSSINRFLGRLCAAAEQGGRKGSVLEIKALQALADAAVDAAAPHAQDLREPLSQRELEVLALIGQGLSNKEIGERLFLALDTIKGHNRRIFDKLDVKRRTEALARARELGLL